MTLPILKITAEVERLIRLEGEASYPNECCRVMVGKLEGGQKLVNAIYPQRNERDDSPKNRFLISPDLVRDAELRAMREGVDVLGYYHSHPDHPAKPSQFDQDHAWPWYSYVIVSIQQGKSTDLTSWQLTDDRSQMIPEPVEMT